MAKYITGTATGPGATDAFFQVIRTHLTNNGWTEHDVISNTSGQRDIVFRGAALDATADNRPFIRVRQPTGTNTLDYLAYTDWDVSAHVGINDIGNTVSTTRQTYQDSSFVYFMRANSVSIAVIAKIGAAYTRAYVGFLRRQLPVHMAGVTKSSGSIAAGSTDIPVSSDLTGRLYVGQTVWLINYNHNNASANKDRVEKHTISVVSSTQITLGEVTTGAFDANTIIGENPLPITVFIQSGATIALTGTSYYSHAADATRTSATAQTGTNYHILFGPLSVDNPSQIDQRFHLGLMGNGHTVGTSSARGLRGYFYHLYSSAAPSPQSTVEDIGDDKNGYTYIIIGADSSNNSYLGPRET